jgi:hypothetical protein
MVGNRYRRMVGRDWPGRSFDDGHYFAQDGLGGTRPVDRGPPTGYLEVTVNRAETTRSVVK